jgi:hypothetical protein
MTDKYPNYSNYQQVPQAQHLHNSHHPNMIIQQQQQMMLQQQQHQQQLMQNQKNHQPNVSNYNNNAQAVLVAGHQNQQTISNPTSDLTSSNSIYLALLGLAETFQQSGQIRLTIHCLESILTLKHQDMPIVTNFHMQLKTRLNLCRLYLKHTTNTNQYVNAHLEKSVIYCFLCF